MWQGMSHAAVSSGGPDALFLIVAFLFGLAVGSFLNVVIYRAPRRLSLVRPGSHCPHCGARIRARDNIPLLSFLLLKGRCRVCRQPISWLYPAVELGTALLFVLLVRKQGWGWSLVPDAVFVSALVALALIDARHRLLPDAITYPGFVLGVGLRALLPVNAPPDLSDSPQEGVLFLLRRWASDYALGVGTALIVMSGIVLFALERMDHRWIGRKLEELEKSAPDGTAPPSPVRDSPQDRESSASGELPERSVAFDVARTEIWSPERVALVGLIGLSAAFLVRGLLDPSFAPSGMLSAARALQGAVIGSGILWLSRLGYYAVRRLEGVGLGDVKMMLMIGAFLGWTGAFMTLFLASILGSLYGVTLMLLTRERNPTLPFGLFLSAAALALLFVV